MSWEASAGIIGVGFLWLLNMTALQLNDEEHASLKAFLVMMSFILAIPLLNFARQMVVDNSGGAELVNMWGIFFGTATFAVFITFLYLFYYWFFSILQMLRRVRDTRREKRGDVRD